MELVSIVVPVYNVDNYLEKCIESIMKQSYVNLEILLVDDGSTDNSGKICDDFSKKDNRIKVCHQKNRGLSSARNTGIQFSTGRYLTFIDSDDYISRFYIENLLNLLVDNDADISICLGQKFYDGEEPEENQINNVLTEVYTSEEALESMLYRKKINSYAWGKIYKRELFNEIKFPEGVLFEDMRTLYKIYDLCNRIAFNPVRLYYYYQRQNSIVNSGFSKKKMEQIYASEDIVIFVDEKYPGIHNAAVSKTFVAAVDIYRRIPSVDEFADEKKYAETIIKKYRKEVLKDKNNKTVTLIIALVAMLNVKVLSFIGRSFQWLIAKKILKIKNPI